jgi:GNAT superfamily N-acetyltransferase
MFRIIVPGGLPDAIDTGMGTYVNQHAYVRRAAPGDASGIARVHVDSWRTTYAGIVHAEVLAALSVEARASFWSRTLETPNQATFHHVAVDRNENVVGFVSGGPERDGHETYKSELYAIYLLEGHQGQGVGKRLVGALIDDLLSAGHSAMMVWVLAENPSRLFYGSLSGQEVATKLITMGPDKLEEIAFGWDDLTSLASRLNAHH